MSILKWSDVPPRDAECVVARLLEHASWNITKSAEHARFAVVWMTAAEELGWKPPVERWRSETVEGLKAMLDDVLATTYRHMFAAREAE